MSVRAKLLTAIVLVNAVVVVALFSFLRAENERVTLEAAESASRFVTREVLRSFASQVSGRRVTIEPLLRYAAFDSAFRDALIVNNPDLAENDEQPSDSEPGFVEINPLGCFHRDPKSFPREAILAGIQQAVSDRTILTIHGGHCIPIERGGQLIGGGWFLPVQATAPSVPSGRILLSVGLGVLVLASFLWFGVERWILGPVNKLSFAAHALEQGQLGVQADAGSGAPELDTLVRSFNRASLQLQVHDEELSQAVDEATERARRRERELVLSQRLAAIGTLAAGIAHEINNPLGGMVNAVSRLRKRKKDREASGFQDEGEDVYLDLLDEGLTRIANIARRTLDFAPRSSEPRPFRLDTSIERARALVAHRAEASNVRIEYTSCEDDLVLGDSHEMSQVFLNLFLNSLDALETGMRAEPRIRVTVETAVDESGEALLMARVEDNGPGADAETIERIFDPFFSTKGATSTSEKLSSGLGMSISFSIVEQHGGAMTASSTPGEGFAVEIRLPRRAEDTAP